MARLTAIVAGLSLLLSGCGSDGGGTATPAPTPTPSASLYTAPAQLSLSVADVQKIIANAAAEARARDLPSVIAVTDRVGNVLAVFAMPGAPATAVIAAAPNGNNIDVQNLTIPAGGGAIAKAVTGAYLSSGGNAFSTRTASQIVQEHFPPAPTTVGLESGPLFGVQFSQLPCSDLNARFNPGGGSSYVNAATGAQVISPAMIGPKRSPLGLAADPGGLPLYKNGVVVGGIGVMGDGAYGSDPNILDIDNDPEEAIALAGTLGFEAPEGIRADRITVDGTLLRYTDVSYAQLLTNGSATYAATPGSLAPVIGYTAGPIVAGVPYGSEASGYRATTAAEFSNADAFVLSDGAGNDRFPIRAATDAGDVAQPLTQAEVRAVLEEAFRIMGRARGQIRKPLDSRAQVTISLVDTRGAVLGLVRSPDAPIFGTDVSLQKARTAAFFSGRMAGADLSADPSADVRAMVAATRSFLGDPAALTGAFAIPSRAVGNLARPYFPDGEIGRPNGPLSRPIAQFNPFTTGLQSALVLTNLAQHLGFVIGASATDTPHRCTFIPDAAAGRNRLQNGIQIFPGSSPIYRGTTLVGAIGVSGDGIDQDDMISFLGLANGATKVATGIANAPAAIRSDTIIVAIGAGVRLRYIRCPVAPFLDTSDQIVCQGI
ncbi:MAG: heme-binding protein [Sphingobium sp.]